MSYYACRLHSAGNQRGRKLCYFKKSQREKNTDSDSVEDSSACRGALQLGTYNRCPQMPSSFRSLLAKDIPCWSEAYRTIRGSHSLPHILFSPPSLLPFPPISSFICLQQIFKSINPLQPRASSAHSRPANRCVWSGIPITALIFKEEGENYL